MRFRSLIGAALLAAAIIPPLGAMSREAPGTQGDSPALGGVESQGISIGAPAEADAGSKLCVDVYVTGQPVVPSVSIEMNGVELVSSVRPIGAGHYIVCFEIPDAGSGSAITVTAVASGSVATASISVSG